MEQQEQPNNVPPGTTVVNNDMMMSHHDQRHPHHSSSQEPLLLQSVAQKCPYPELAMLLRQIRFSDPSSSSCSRSGWCLSSELMRRIVSFLVIEPVDPARVTVTTCSSRHSSSSHHSLSQVLVDSEDSWWISASGSMPHGQGNEYLEFSLNGGNDDDNHARLYRLSAISIKIPPLPLGPLSVWHFQLHVPLPSCGDSARKTWTPLGNDHDSVYTVANVTGWQRFPVVPAVVDVSAVRVVCLRNQISQFLELNPSLRSRTEGLYDSVGLYAVRFE